MWFRKHKILLIAAVVLAAAIAAFFLTQNAAPQADGEMHCTISILCDTVLDNLSALDPEKTELVPEGGVILPPTEVAFSEGESVFDVLRRVCTARRIHLEFADTPMYHSVYIEGISNLYEFDCGELSGWMYSVNGWFPNYGCSRYVLKDGDEIVWRFTCDLGADIGGGEVVQNDS